MPAASAGAFECQQFDRLGRDDDDGSVRTVLMLVSSLWEGRRDWTLPALVIPVRQRGQALPSC
jgi:hypothetical protein